MALDLQKCILEQKFQLPTPTKFGSLVFQVSTETENLCQPLCKNGSSSPKMHPRAKLPITDPPILQVWVSSFRNVDGNGNFASTIMQKLKNGYFNPPSSGSSRENEGGWETWLLWNHLWWWYFYMIYYYRALWRGHCPSTPWILWSLCTSAKNSKHSLILGSKLQACALALADLRGWAKDVGGLVPPPRGNQDVMAELKCNNSTDSE